LVALLAGAVVLGLAAGCRPTGPAAAPVASLPQAEDQRGDGSGPLLDALAAEILRLERREAEVRRRVHEAEVAIRLLRRRGKSATDPSVREQTEKRDQAESELGRLRQERDEARRLQSALRQSGRGAPENDDELDRDLQRRVWAWVLSRQAEVSDPHGR
jgi:hypothetical protein